MGQVSVCANCGTHLGNGQVSLGLCACKQQGCTACAIKVLRPKPRRHEGEEETGRCHHRKRGCILPVGHIDIDGIYVLDLSGNKI